MKLSVALGTFNGARYIQQQLTSILEQEVKVHEIIVCDDGSSDSTIQIVNQMKALYPDVDWKIVVSQQNRGVLRNFEMSLSLCTGDIIFLSDQDDIWKPQKTREILQFFEKNKNWQVVFTDADLIDDKDQVLTTHSLLDAVGLLPNIALWEAGLNVEILMKRNRATGATMALHRSFLRNCLPFNTKGPLHDEQIAVIASLMGKLGVITERLISYRQHGNNVIGVPCNSWVYTNDAPPNLLSQIVEPIPLTPFWIENMQGRSRFRFYQYRIKNYTTIKGKILLLLSVRKYKKYYSVFWLAFFLSDFLYGISAMLRQRLLSSMNVSKTMHRCNRGNS